MKHVIDATTFREHCVRMSRCPVVFLDTETTGLNPHTCNLLLLSARYGEETIVVDFTRIPVTELDYFNRYVTSNERVKKVFHNAVFDVKQLFHLGCNFENVACTFVNEALLTAGYVGMSSSLAAVVHRRLGEEMSKEVREQFIGFSGRITYEQLLYAAKDVEVMPAIYAQQMRELLEQDLLRTVELENSIIVPTALMEYYGVRVDTSLLATYEKPFADLLRKSDTAIQDYAISRGLAEQIIFSRDGYVAINTASPSQMLAFFNKCGIKVESTGAKQLAAWDARNAGKTFYEEDLTNDDLDVNIGYHHPLLNVHGVRSAVEKLLNTYVYGIRDRLVGNRIYPNFNQLGARATGRYSSSNPNFQNMPKHSTLSALNMGAYDIRSLFIPDPGNVFIIADYSAIELVIAACFSGDEVLLNQLAAGDVHSYVATSMFGVEVTSSNKEHEPYSVLRDCSKTLTYAKLYGTTGGNLERTLAARLGRVGIDVRPGDGDRWIEAWQRTFPTAGAFLQQNSQHAVTRGYVTTIIGRRRRWNTTFQNKWQFWAAEREGSNSGIQGSSADMVKLAIARIFPLLNYPYERIVATVHDELIAEVPQPEAQRCSEIIQGEMEMAGKELFPIALKFNVIKASTKVSDRYNK